MKKLLYLIILVGGGIYVYQHYLSGMTTEEMAQKIDGSAQTAVDVAVDRPAINGLDRVKNSVAEVEMEQYRDAVQQFYIYNNRYPTSLEEVVDKHLLPSSALRDPYGQPYRAVFSPGMLVLSSPGKDQIANTPDDIRVEVPLK